MLLRLLIRRLWMCCWACRAIDLGDRGFKVGLWLWFELNQRERRPLEITERGDFLAVTLVERSVRVWQ